VVVMNWRPRTTRTSTWRRFFCRSACGPHFESVYAFCRVSDDLGDEVADTSTALRLLEAWDGMLDECYDAPERSRHPVFVALRETIVSCDLPRGLFHDLLRAFIQDQNQDDVRDLGRGGGLLALLGDPVGGCADDLRVPR